MKVRVTFDLSPSDRSLLARSIGRDGLASHAQAKLAIKVAVDKIVAEEAEQAADVEAMEARDA